MTPQALRDLLEDLRSMPQASASLVELIEMYRPKLSEEYMCDWIADACGGQQLLYHLGLLAADRSESMSCLSRPERQRVHSLGCLASSACELGLVRLHSVRLAEQCFGYFAVRVAGKPLVRTPGA